jgi:hypothetical protein
MSPPRIFEFIDAVAHYRPIGTVTIDEAAVLVIKGLEACQKVKQQKLLIDTRRLDFGNPSLADRFFFVEQLSVHAKGIAIALVLHAHLIDVDRFGVTVARNRGLTAEVFTSEIDALNWLRNPSADQ